MTMADQLPEYDNRPGFFVTHEMPDNIKIAGLSDAAFRTLVRAWSYCSRLRTDGAIPKAVWNQLGTPKARKELLAPPAMAPDKEPLFIQTPGGVVAHDYLRHNRSAQEMRVASSAKGQAGALGAHTRWHVLRRRFDASCEFCQAEKEA